MDTIGFIIEKNHFNRNEILELFKEKGIVKTVSTTRCFGTVETYQYYNWLFFLSEKSLKATGSLEKLYKGENVTNSTFIEHCKSLNHLEDVLQGLFYKARITRIDFGITMQMSEPAQQYIPLLSQPSHTKKIAYGKETVCFEGYLVDREFYDKGLSIRNDKKRKKEKIITTPPDNLLRYEIRFKGKQLKMLNLPHLGLESLYDKQVYATLLDKWYQGYIEIPKSEYANDLSEMPSNSVENIKQFLIGLGINACGGINEVKVRLQHTKMKRKVRFDVIKYINEKLGKILIKKQLQQELENAINNYYQLLNSNATCI